MQKVNVDHSTNDSSSKKGEDKSYSFERVLRDWILKMKLKLMVKLKNGKESLSWASSFEKFTGVGVC